MKKTIIILAALLFTIGANAQNVKFGLKGGLNLSQISEMTIKESGEKDASFDVAPDMLMGFHVGGLVNISFGEFFGLQPELFFSTQGGKSSNAFGLADFSEYIDGIEFKFKLNYINVPVLFEVKPITNFSLLVGPQIGLNMSRTISISGGGESATISGSDFDDMFEGEAKFSKIDFAAVVGAQYAVMGKFLISARYNLGFAPIFKSEVSDIKVTGGANRVIQVNIGWLF